MASGPSVMVSSTFYDLRQIRANLGQFISEDLGYTPLLSELASFPVDPDLDTVENCRLRVEANADILVLVIGGRYGSLDTDTDKSVTNLEFLAARRKGIPIYAFVRKEILAILPVWQMNPSADFSQVVDTSKLFRFVEEVRNEKRVWTFPFETANDIITALRYQFAHLFHDALTVRLRLDGAGLPAHLETLKSKSLRIALERPRAWEYRLFLQVWLDQVENLADPLKEYREGLKIELAESVSANHACDWMRLRMSELEAFANSATKLVNKCAQAAFGPSGQPGNVEEIVWVSRALGKLLENILKWASRIRCAQVEAPFDQVAPHIARMTDGMVNEFTEFPREALAEIENAAKTATPEQPQEITKICVLKLSNEEAFYEALRNAERRLHGGL